MHQVGAATGTRSRVRVDKKFTVMELAGEFAKVKVRTNGVPRVGVRVRGILGIRFRIEILEASTSDARDIRYRPLPFEGRVMRSLGCRLSSDPRDRLYARRSGSEGRHAWVVAGLYGSWMRRG